MSTDRTREIAASNGATFLQREWRGYIDARLYALSAVRTPYTLMIDADEALDERLRRAIEAAAEDTDGYRLARTTFFCGKPMRIWSSEPILRLFRTSDASLASRGMDNRAQVHEAWSVPGTVADLPGTLLHYSYPTQASYRAKFEQYTAIEAQALHATPLRVWVESAKSLLRLPFLLFARGAILDGWRGIYTAWWSAWYPAIAYRKALKRT